MLGKKDALGPYMAVEGVVRVSGTSDCLCQSLVVLRGPLAL